MGNGARRWGVADLELREVGRGERGRWRWWVTLLARWTSRPGAAGNVTGRCGRGEQTGAALGNGLASSCLSARSKR